MRKTAVNPLPPVLFTIPEAAWAARTVDKFVNGEVDKKVVQTSFNGKRMLAEWDLLYLCAVRTIGASMNIELRKQIYQKVRLARQQGNSRRIVFGHFVLNLETVIHEMSKRIADISAARDTIQINPHRKGGDPVVKGTRIPVRLLGELARQGTCVEEISVEYDLSQRQVDLALLYDKLHPRRGRPMVNLKNDGFSDLGENRREEVEELGEYREP